MSFLNILKEAATAAKAGIETAPKEIPQGARAAAKANVEEAAKQAATGTEQFTKEAADKALEASVEASKVSEKVVDDAARESLAPPATAPAPDVKPIDDATKLRVDKKIAKSDEPTAKIATELNTATGSDFDYLATNHLPRVDLMFDGMEKEGDVKSIVLKMADRNRAEIQKQRRGVVHDVDVNSLALEMGVSGEALKSATERNIGGVLDDATFRSVKWLVEQSGARVARLSKLYVSGEASQKQIVELRRQMVLHDEIMAQFMGARAETARAFRANQIRMSEDGLDTKTLERLHDATQGKDFEDRVRALATAEDIGAVNEIIKGGWYEKLLGVVHESFIGSILSGVKTFIVNATGTPIMLTSRLAELGYAAQRGRFRTGDEKVMIGEAQATLAGYLAAAGDAVKVGSMAFKTGRNPFKTEKYALDFKKHIEASNLGADADSAIGRVIKCYWGIHSLPDGARPQSDGLGWQGDCLPWRDFPAGVPQVQATV